MRLRNRTMDAEQTTRVTSKDIAVYEDPFSYFADVIKGNIKMKNYDLYSLQTTLLLLKF